MKKYIMNCDIFTGFQEFSDTSLMWPWYGIGHIIAIPTDKIWSWLQLCDSFNPLVTAHNWADLNYLYKFWNQPIEAHKMSFDKIDPALSSCSPFGPDPTLL